MPVTIPSRCSCGRTHGRAVGGILGRADDMVIYRGAKFYPVQVEKVVRSYRELGDEFIIEITRDERAMRMYARWCASASIRG